MKAKMTNNQPSPQDYFNAGFKALRCKGYNKQYNRYPHDSPEAYKEAKGAITPRYTDPQYNSLTLDEITAWEASGGWIGWTIPKGYIALDVEDKDDIIFLMELCKNLDLTIGIHKTTNGYHLLFRCDEDISAQTKAGINCGIKITYRVGGKGYLILAPTLGRTWEKWGSIDNLSELPEEFKPAHDAIPTLETNNGKAVGSRPGDMFAAKTSWDDILTPHGWVRAFTHGGIEHWRRPGKTAGSSATIGHHGTNYFHCFTDESVFNQDKSYSKFAVYTALNHNGDYKAAAGELAQKGFGEPKYYIETSDNVEQEVTDWVMGQIHPFRISTCQKELTLKLKTEFAIARQVFKNLFMAGIIDCIDANGLFQKKQNSFNLITPVLTDPLPIDWPLNIQELTQLKPKELMTVAGVYGAGKTAFCLNVAEKNMFLFQQPVRYIASELNEHELAWKLEYLPLLKMQLEKKVLFIERMDRPWEVIDPHGLNIIDYLEKHDDFYNIGKELAKCQAMLKTGIAIVCLQKNPAASMARGGAGTMQKPSLVLNLEVGEAIIKKARHWVNPSLPPVNKKIYFKLRHSVIMEAIGSWQEETDEDEIISTPKRTKR